MKKAILALTLAATGLLTSAQSSAEVTIDFAHDMTIDLSVFGNNTNFFDVVDPLSFFATLGNGDNNDVTAKFDDIGFSGLWATSIYDMSDSSVFGSFFDTNVASDLAAYGVPGTYPSLASIDAGTPGFSTVSLTTPTATQNKIEALNPVSDPSLFSTNDDEGYGSSWYFSTEFRIDGTLNSTTPNYTGGHFNLIFNSVIGGSTTQETVLEAAFNRDSVAVDGTDSSAASAQMWFDITSAKAGLFTTYSSNGSATDLGTLALTDNAPEFRLAFIIDPAIPTAEQLAFVDNQNGPVAVRQTTLDGSGQLSKVPDPASIALLGLGLLALASRKRLK
jgi:hypothetical protein